MRKDWIDSNDSIRVRVFIDHWEFSQSWQIAYSGFTGRQLTPADLKNAQIEAQDLRWELLPDTILEHLDELEYISEDGKELRNVDVYASSRKGGEDNALVNWLEESLDPLPGFEVHHFEKNKVGKEIQCSGCGALLNRPDLEKGLKTAIACDLLSHAVKDLYDIAVILVDDPELAPSVLCVQEVFDKKVVHIGLKTRGKTLRSAAWGHVLLDDLVRDLFQPDDFKKKRRR